MLREKMGAKEEEPLLDPRAFRGMLQVIEGMVGTRRLELLTSTVSKFGQLLTY